MDKFVAHPCDFLPGNIGVLFSEIVRQLLGGLADNLDASNK